MDAKEAVKKIIIITDCMECPKVSKCSAWKKLTSKQRFILKTGVGIGKVILKDCLLESYHQSKLPSDEELNIVDIKRIKDCIEFVKSLPDGVMDEVNWGMEEGILITGNEAILFIKLLKSHLSEQQGRSKL